MACRIEDCDRPVKARGWCAKHYQRWVKHGDPLHTKRPRDRRCEIDGCDAKHFARGWCYLHYRRWRDFGDPHLERDPNATRIPREGVCDVDGCERDIHAKRLCHLHYERLNTYGSFDAPEIDRNALFWEKVEIRDNSCWEWTGTRNHKGYGQVTRYQRRHFAHRVAYELRRGPIPEGLELDHLCCNPACVRPSHLEPVTHAENLRRARERKARRVAA